MRISDWSSDVCSSDLSSGVLSFDGVQLAAPRPLPAGIEDRMVDDELRQRLVTLIEVDRIHLDPDLTFAMFVQRMNAPERAVRRSEERSGGKECVSTGRSGGSPYH